MGHKDFDVIGLGEIMLRLSPMGVDRISTSETLEKHPGGSEFNVVSGVSILGLRTAVVSKLPNSQIGEYIKNKIRFHGVSDDYLIYDDTDARRVGIYYYESGAFPRKPSITYDRKNSSFSSIDLSEIDSKIYSATKVFHTSGITLALNEKTRDTAIEMIKNFKKNDTLISFDVNYRANLWDEDTAYETICKVLPYVDILFVSEETSRRMMKRTGTMEEIMRGYCEEFGMKIVACTNRIVKTPKCHSFNSTMYTHDDNKFYNGKTFDNIDVIDRIGSGDAYVAGALWGLISHGNPQIAVDFGNAMSAVKSTVVGDLPNTNYNEIERVVEINNSGIAGSELNR
ncbi:MAG: sugar kinase [Oscillospiraceae bacterium]